MSFVELLDRQIAERPWQRALVMPAGMHGGRQAWTQLLFSELAERVDSLSKGLTDAGFAKGDRVVMLVKPGFDFFAVGFALWRIGAIPVVVDPGMGRQGFLDCVAQIQPVGLVGIPAAMALSSVFSGPFKTVQRRVTLGGSTLFWGGHTLADLDKGGVGPRPSLGDDEEAAVLFTSGSTGPAKGVRYTHGMFRAQSRLIGETYGIRAGEVDVPCFLPFAIFSVTLGMTVVLPEMDFARPVTAEPAKLARAVNEHGAVQLVGSPTPMRRLADWCQKEGVKLPSLRRVLTFGASIPPALHRDLQAVSPAEVHTPYGATECLPIASTSSAEVLSETAQASAEGAGTCVGMPVPGLELRIVAITDEAMDTLPPGLPVGEVGELVVRGPQVSTEYKERPEANRLSKIQDGAGVWHRMGDLAYLDQRGRIWFCGRKAHRVETKDGRVLFPDKVEGVFNVHPAIARSALVGVAGRPVIVVELKQGRTATAEEMLAVGKGSVEAVLFHPSFPVDRRHNAKIHREELAEWAKGKLA